MGNIKKNWMIYAAIGILIYFWLKDRSARQVMVGPPSTLAGDVPPGAMS